MNDYRQANIFNNEEENCCMCQKICDARHLEYGQYYCEICYMKYVEKKVDTKPEVIKESEDDR